jgi:hypothetical protein
VIVHSSIVLWLISFCHQVATSTGKTSTNNACVLHHWWRNNRGTSPVLYMSIIERAKCYSSIYFDSSDKLMTKCIFRKISFLAYHCRGPRWPTCEQYVVMPFALPPKVLYKCGTTGSPTVAQSRVYLGQAVVAALENRNCATMAHVNQSFHLFEWHTIYDFPNSVIVQHLCSRRCSKFRYHDLAEWSGSSLNWLFFEHLEELVRLSIDGPNSSPKFWT